MSKTARIEIRAEPGQEDQIRRAAGLVNQSISAFVVTSAVERADEVMAKWSTTTVPTEFFDQLMAALDEPAPANEALRKVARQRKPGRVA